MAKEVVALFILVLFLSFASAITTDISGKTLPYAKVQISIIKQSGSEISVLQLLRADANQYGDFNFTYSSDETTFLLNAYVKWNDETIFSKRFTEPFTAGEPISLTLAESGTVLAKTPGVDNSSDENTTATNSTTTNSTNQTITSPPPAQENVTNVAENTNPTVTGNVLADTEGISFKTEYLYYIFGVIVIAGILFFISKAKGRHSSSQFNFRPATKGEASHVMQLERKLHDAEKEIHILKNQDKIKSVEQRIADEKRELERLKHGEI